MIKVHFLEIAVAILLWTSVQGVGVVNVQNWTELDRKILSTGTGVFN